jgi:hypothetical protein
MKNPSHSLRAAAFAAGSLLACAASAAAQVTYGTYEQPLEGRRYETLRALANYVDEAAQQALQEAIADARYGSAAERRQLVYIRQFARQADNFHQRVDNYQADPGDVADEVEILGVRARRASARTRALESTRDDFTRITDAIDRMKRLMNGEDVQVPSAYGTTEDYERDYGPFGGYGTGVRGFTGAEVQQFRQLGRDLNVSANRAWRLAQRSSNVAGVERYIASLQHFATQAADLQRRADEKVMDVNEVGPVVTHLLEDARAADRDMRQGRVLRDVWYEWTHAISLLTQMNDMVTRR